MDKKTNLAPRRPVFIEIQFLVRLCQDGGSNGMFWRGQMNWH